MKIFLVFATSIYSFILLGLLFHTSHNPRVLGKYSIHYFLGFIFVILLGSLFAFLLSRIVIRFKKKISKKEKQYFKKLTIVSLVLLITVILSTEFFLRQKYEGFDSVSYKFTIDDVHPFLQSKLSNNQLPDVNSYGFRSEEIPVAKPRNVYRIAVLGGSTVLNREVAYKRNAVYLLEKRLQQEYPNKKIQIINAGKDWYTSEHSLIQYLFLIRDFHPDMVIMWHGINDLYASCTPSEVNFGPFKSDYSHLFGAVSQMTFSYFKIPPIFSVKLVSLDLASRFLFENLYSDFTNKIRDKKVSEQSKSFLKKTNQFTITFPSLPVYRRNLVEFLKILELDNVIIILGNQPSLYKNNPSEDESKYLIFPQMGCANKGRPFSLQTYLQGIKAFNKITKDVASNTGVDFVDLNGGVPKEKKYFVDSIHFSELGNSRIADILYKEIVSKEYILQ